MRSERARAFVGALALLLSGCASAASTLCTASETVVFSCRIGARLVSLCQPSPVHRALVFRMGSEQSLDAVYPDPASGRPGEFSLLEAPLAGGGLTAVVFRHGGVEYRVYSRVSRGDDQRVSGQRIALFEDGVEIRLQGGRPTCLVCDDGGAGFLEAVDWLPPAPR